MAPPKKVKGKRGYKEIEHSEEEEEQVPEEGQAPEEVNPPMDVDEEDDQEELEEWSQEERKKLVSYGYSHSGKRSGISQQEKSGKRNLIQTPHSAGGSFLLTQLTRQISSQSDSKLGSQQDE